MASTPLYPDSQQGVDALLKRGDRVKDYVAAVTEKYATSPESSLDGQIHPSLQSPGSLVPVKLSGTNAMVNAPRSSAETKETKV